MPPMKDMRMATTVRAEVSRRVTGQAMLERFTVMPTNDATNGLVRIA